MKKITLLAMAIVVSAPAWGALSIDHLPASLRDELYSGAAEFTVNDNAIASVFSATGVNAYSFDRNGEGRVLIEYQVDPATSHWGPFNPATLGGRVFVDVAQSYDLSTDNHPISIYFDGLTPDGIASNFFFNPTLLSTEVVFTGAAVAASTGYMIKQEDYDVDFVNSTMLFSDGLFGDNFPFLCVECGISYQLNLLFLDYSAGGNLSFNFDDTRRNLIAATDFLYGDQPYGYDLNIDVRGVPLPPAWLLFGVALTALKSRRTTRCPIPAGTQ